MVRVWGSSSMPLSGNVIATQSDHACSAPAQSDAVSRIWARASIARAVRVEASIAAAPAGSP